MEEDKPLAAFYAYDRDELDTLSHATGYFCALYDIEQFVRGKIKWGNNYKTVEETLEAIQSELCDEKAKYHLPE